MNFLPKSLFGRFLLIILIPLIILQLVIAYIFYQRHWDNVTQHMQNTLVAEINWLVHSLMNVSDIKQIEKVIQDGNILNFQSKFLYNQSFSEYTDFQRNDDYDLNNLQKELGDETNMQVVLYGINDQSNVRCLIQLPLGLLQVDFSSKRIRSPTTYIFILWMIGTSTLLVIVSLIFMKNQLRSIVNLTYAADKLGKGDSVINFHPAGAKEIRMAGVAFIRMKKRIERQIKHRTELLAHISHDLRTPITRMKLQLAVLQDNTIANLFNKNLDEMELMLSSYLNFAKGEGNEVMKLVNMAQFVNNTIIQFQNSKLIFINELGDIEIGLRVQAMKRAIYNVINNALIYANLKIEITLKKIDDYICIIVDDDGPGIPQEQYKAAFKPFNKLNNKNGFGLGLAITKTVIHAHGGQIKLSSSPYSGLRVVIKIPH